MQNQNQKITMQRNISVCLVKGSKTEAASNRKNQITSEIWIVLTS